MPLDVGGARMRETEDWPQPRTSRHISMPGIRVPPDPPAGREATVTVHVTETHDGEPCECIEKDMTLRVGQEVELTHVCHDGRVDKVVARVSAITAAVEHGAAVAR